MNQTINISLPKNLTDLIKEQVTDGYYSSVSEVIRDALRHFLAPQPIQLTKKSAKLYDKMSEELDSGKNIGTTANSADELMIKLNKLPQ